MCEQFNTFFKLFSLIFAGRILYIGKFNFKGWESVADGLILIFCSGGMRSCVFANMKIGCEYRCNII
jgi:hypothetical protein